MTTPTPRTDAAICRYTGGECVTFPAGLAYVVPYIFAQELERDLAARDAELAEIHVTGGCSYIRLNEALQRAEAAERDEWKEAVLNELIVAHIYTKEYETNPLKAIRDAITWNCQVALDPLVSSDAQRLRDTYLHRAEAAERELAAMKAENSKLRSALEIVHFKQEPWQ